ncbi:MAG: glycosyltransferase family 2 protein [Pseudonocardia sp.]
MFLDVDCISGPDLFRRYQASVRDAERRLLCGPVAYLPPRPPGGYRPEALADMADPHPARPAPPDGVCVDGEDHALFRSLSFAATMPLWTRSAGFHEGYRGYGGEDTDLGQQARVLGIGLRWVGGATAYHQHHPITDPPVEHLDDILRNAALFHSRWGWWPMRGCSTASRTRGWSATTRYVIAGNASGTGNGHA